MITPTVIRNSDDARRLTDEYSSQFRALEPLRAKGMLPPVTEPTQPVSGAAESDHHYD